MAPAPLARHDAQGRTSSQIEDQAGREDAVPAHGLDQLPDLGVDKEMPAFSPQLSEEQRWELVLWVRELRTRQLYQERIELGTYEWKLPLCFLYPNVPSTNLMTAEKVELGRHLSYDKRLSLNRTQSCASCHQQAKAFTDGRSRAVGSTGETHPRGSMSLLNVAYNTVLTWANPNLKKLEEQALAPMFGDHPVELGMAGQENLLRRRLRAEPTPFSLSNVTKAIALFQQTLLSGDSPYDEYRRGDDPNAISESAKRSYPEANLGLFEFARREKDIGKFKAPTLRNIAPTALYMHDGSVKTLEEAIDHYKAAAPGKAAAPVKHMLRGEVAAVYAADRFRIGTDPSD